MSITSILSGIWDVISHTLFIQIGAVIGGILITLWAVFRKKIKSTREYFRRIDAAIDAVKRNYINGEWREGDGLWIAEPVRHPQNYKANLRASKILCIANLKGGVGKTTIAANVASCLSIKLNQELPRNLRKPVLLIDLDFQGTLAGMAVPDPDIWPPQNKDSHATQLICGDLTTEHLLDLRFRAAKSDYLEIIPAYYELAQAENRTMIEWLLGDRSDDLRFKLTTSLHEQRIQDQYHLIVIDCPPRLTTAAIQSLAVSSHLLIPTIIDAASYSAVTSFIGQVETFRNKNICPQIQHIGVVGSILDPRRNYEADITELSDKLSNSLENNGANGVTSLLNPNTFIPSYKAVADAYGQGIVYPMQKSDNSDQALKFDQAVENLSRRIKQKMGLIGWDELN